MECQSTSVSAALPQPFTCISRVVSTKAPNHAVSVTDHKQKPLGVHMHASVRPPSVIRSVSWTASQSINQSVKPSTNQPTNQPINQPVNQPVSQSASQSASQPVSQPASQSASQSASQHIRLAGRLWVRQPGNDTRGEYQNNCCGCWHSASTRCPHFDTGNVALGARDRVLVGCGMALREIAGRGRDFGHIQQLNNISTHCTATLAGRKGLFLESSFYGRG